MTIIIEYICTAMECSEVKHNNKHTHNASSSNSSRRHTCASWRWFPWRVFDASDRERQCRRFVYTSSIDYRLLHLACVQNKNEDTIQKCIVICWKHIARIPIVYATPIEGDRGILRERRSHYFLSTRSAIPSLRTNTQHHPLSTLYP